LQTQERSSHACERKGKKTQGREALHTGTWPPSRSRIHAPKVAGATVARPKQTQTFASSVYGAKHIESETTQTECLCLDEKEASELERELEVEALNHLL